MKTPRKMQLCRRVGFARPQEYPILKGPFDCEVEGYQFKVVLVKCGDERAGVRSLIDVRSGMRVAQIATAKMNKTIIENLPRLMNALATQYGAGEVRRRIETAASLTVIEGPK